MSTQYRIPSNDNYIRDLENISQRERHGLFNQPPPLLLGDQYNDAIKSQGKEKGIMVNKKLQKKHEPALFQEPGYTTLNDPYKDQFKAKQIYDKERELAIKNPNCFKPNDHVKSMYLKNSEFEHMKEFNDKVYTINIIPEFILELTIFQQMKIKNKVNNKFKNLYCNTRTPTGDVRTQARNFLTNPAKRGLGRTTSNNLFGQIEYIPDPYDRQEEIERQERIKHKSKFLPGTTRFITTNHGNRPFTADGILLDGAGYLSQKKRPFYKGAPFRPANQNKQGFQGTFEVLQYMEEGAPDPKTKQNTFQQLSATQTYEKPWRPNSNGTFARPCPSVSQQLRNRSVGSNQKG